MATKNNSSGTQHTPRGVNQGVTLVAHESGRPIDSIVDINGKRRLCVDANVTIGSAVVNVDIDSDTDNIAIRNTVNDDELLIYPDGTIKVRLTDASGTPFSPANPLPVSIQNTSLAVQLTAADGDNVAIHDSDGDELNINPDGSINVKIPVGFGGTFFSKFSDVTSVSSSSLTTILTHTVPALTSVVLYRIEVSGTNIATYEFYVNSTLKGRRRTWFNGNMSESFEFPVSGYKLSATDTIDVKVIHTRPSLGDFEARLHGETI